MFSLRDCILCRLGASTPGRLYRRGIPLKCGQDGNVQQFSHPPSAPHWSLPLTRSKATLTSWKQRKWRYQTPSEELSRALEKSGYNIDLAASRDSVDLSWIAPAHVTDWNHRKVAEEHQRLPARRPTRLSLPSIVARYIEFIDPILRSAATDASNGTNLENSLDEAILSVFDDNVIEFLAAKGYSIEDVVSWAWVLTSKRTFTATARCAILENDNCDDVANGSSSFLPSFILNFTLRRQHIDSESLRVFLWLSARTLGKDPHNLTHHGPGKSTLLNSGDYSSTMIIFIRLIRAATKVLPTALPYIAELFASVFSPATLAEVSQNSKEKDIRHYTKFYNKCLSLLARPCAIEPYHSVSFQHRAIFHLLREMTQFKPALHVTREGYQAIIRVQAARRKTPAEKEWADFKAKSWPPWKEDKLGIDAERGNEGKLSKTAQAIRHMTEAGYGMTTWERVASVVGGWDIDGTPTIQTRTLLPRPSWFRKRPRVLGLSGSQALSAFSDPVIWQARIRATRTLKEAWACFLASREYGVKPDKYVYFEMMQKLFLGHFDVGSESFKRHGGEVLPGDGKEVLPEPTSPRDVIYVKCDPPTPEEFLRQMIGENMRASRMMLVLVFKYTDSFNAGLMCLRHSELSEPQIRSLSHMEYDQNPDRQELLRKIPDHIFAAFIGFLCRFYQPKKRDPAVGWRDFFPILFPTQGSPGQRYDAESCVVSVGGLSHATFLMRLRMPRYLPAWYNLISALQQKRILYRPSILPVPLQRVFAWRETMQVLQWMEGIDLKIDIQGFELLCQEFSRTLQTYSGHEELTERAFWRMQGFAPNTSPEHPWPDIMTMFKSVIRSMDDHFYHMVAPRGKGQQLIDSLTEPSNGSLHLSTIPALIPSPHALHSFIRVLGYTNDRERLMKLLLWMKEAEEDLQVAVENRSSGKLQMRRCVIALRVFLERFNKESLNSIEERRIKASEEGEELGEGILSDPAVEEAYAIVQDSELMYPWPTMDEVYEYREEMSPDIPLYRS